MDERPDIEAFRPKDKDGNILPMQKHHKVAFANALLSWYVQWYADTHQIMVINKRKSAAGQNDIQLALFWEIDHLSEFLDEPKSEWDEKKAHWQMQPFTTMDNVKGASGVPLLNRILIEWNHGLLSRYPETQHLINDLDYQNRVHDRVRLWLAKFNSASLEVLNSFDSKKGKEHHFRFCGQTFELKRNKETGFWGVEPVLNRPEYYLLGDVPVDYTDPLLDDEYIPICSDELMEKWLTYVRQLFPNYEVKPTDSKEDIDWCGGLENDYACARVPNYAVELLGRQLGKVGLPVAIKELTILYGRGKNGKSMLLEILHNAFDDETPGSISLLLGKSQIFTKLRDAGAENKQKGDRGLMLGKQLLFCQDEDARYLSGGFIKPATGGETVQIGGVNMANLNVRLNALSFMASNNNPGMDEHTRGLDRRLYALSCDVEFPENDPNTMGETEILEWGREMIPAIRKWMHMHRLRHIRTRNLLVAGPLPQLLTEERDAIFDKGKQEIAATIDTFLEKVPEGKAKMLLGGQSSVHGYEIGKKRYYGYMLVVKLMVDKNELQMKDWKPPRIRDLIDTEHKASMYKGTANIYKGLRHTKALADWLREETGNDGALRYLYSRDGDPNKMPDDAPGLDRVPRVEERPDTGSPEDEDEDIPW